MARRLGYTIAIASFCLTSMNTTISAQTTQDDKLPQAEALLQKMIKAAGGEKVIRSHNHQTLTGTFSVPAQGLMGSLSIYSAAPNLQTLHLEIENIGELLNGYDGKTAWSVHPMNGPDVLEGAQREGAVIQADYYATINYKKNYDSIEVVGKTEFGGKDCYELKLVTPEGVESSTFIDASSYLVIGSIRTVETPQGELEVTTVSSEYKEFDGEMIATKSEQDFGGFMQQTITFEEVSFEAFDHAIFEYPESIKKLVEKEGAASQPDD
ncbi:MAG: hypothetical protein O7G85_14320 [Planctomycetota bacterium]|nr:hypothetical protein [Planctomycetota bacterium]